MATTMIENMKEIAKQKLGVIGGLAGDFARRLGATADIPKTVYQGTQTAGGANIPTVQETESKAVANTPSAGALVKDLGIGVSRVFNNVNTPTASLGAKPVASTPPPVASPAPVVATPPPVESVSREPGDPNFFKGGASFNGNTVSSFGATGGMSDKDLADWKVRGIRTGNGGVLEGREGLDMTDKDKAFTVKTNPNDALFQDVLKKLVDVANSGPAIGRATNVAALKGALNELGPQTSFGHFGVAGMQADTTKRGQDILAETSRRGQDITAETAKGLQGIYKDKNAMDALYQSGLIELGKEKNDIERLKTDAKTPDVYLKLLTTVSPKIKSIDPVTGNETETHDLEAGIKMLTASGFKTPKGFNLSTIKGPSLDDFLAAAKKKGTKLTDEQLTQYYNETYGKGG